MEINQSRKPTSALRSIHHDSTLYSIDYRSSTDPTRWKVKLGAHQTESKQTGFEQVREVKNIILHPRYWGKTEDGVLVQPPDYDVGE